MTAEPARDTARVHRRRARELALLYLYETDLLGMPAETPAEFLEHWEPAADRPTREAFSGLVVAVLGARDDLDGAIAAASINWDIARMGVVERNVLRLGAAELGLADLPREIVLDAAIELAKTYGSPESGGFVNGILDEVASRADG